MPFLERAVNKAMTLKRRLQNANSKQSFVFGAEALASEKERKRREERGKRRESSSALLCAPPPGVLELGCQQRVEIQKSKKSSALRVSRCGCGRRPALRGAASLGSGGSLQAPAESPVTATLKAPGDNARNSTCLQPVLRTVLVPHLQHFSQAVAKADGLAL